MKKLAVLTAVLAFVFALFVPQAIAGKKVEKVVKVKVDVCHIIAANDVVYGFLNSVNDLYFGKVISVSESALDAHLAHGDYDCSWSGDAAAGPIDLFRENGVNLPAANCYFGVNSETEIPYGPPECEN